MNEIDNEFLTRLFWKQKGIEDVSRVSVREMRLFIDELKSFKEGFLLGVRYQKENWKNEIIKKAKGE